MSHQATSVSITTAVGEPANLYVPPPPPSDLTVSAALRYLKLTPGATISISDSATNIQKNLATLQSLNGRITAVRASSDASVLTVSYKEYTADKGILSKWSNNAGHQFIFTDVTAAAANTLWNNDFTNKLSIRDTAINLQNNFDNLVSIQNQNNSKITAVTQSNVTALITLNTTQYAAAKDSLGFFTKLNKGISNIAVTGASVYDVVHSNGLRLGSELRVKSISIVDSTDNIDININLLQNVGMKIKTISQDNMGIDKTLELDATEIKNNSSVLGKIITGYQLAAQNTAASQLNAMLSNRKVISIDVKDSASNISRNWDSINKINSSINFVEVSDSDNPIKIKASQLALSQGLINKFNVPAELAGVSGPTGEFKLEISEATASQVEELQASEQISAFDIKDTAENIGLYLADLKNSVDASNGKLRFIKTANSAQIEMSYATYSDPDTTLLLAKVNKGLYNIKLTDVTVDDLDEMTDPSVTSNLLFADKAINSVEIKDSALNVQSNLSLLNSAGSRIKSIDLSYNLDGEDLILVPLTVDANDFISRQKVLDKIIGGYMVDIENATAKQALTLASNPHITSIDIEDTASNFSSYWNQLIDINDRLDDVAISGTRISVTADQYEAGLALDDDLQAKILSSGVTVQFAIKNATIEQALSLITDDTSSYIGSVEIKDTGANITANFSELKDLLANKVLRPITLYQTDSRVPLEISYDDFEYYDTVLDEIIGQGYRLSVSGMTVDNALNMVASNPNPAGLNYRNVSAMHIEDTTTELNDNFNALLGIGKKLASIKLTNPTDNIVITHDQFLKGKSVLDKINDNYFLELTETAVYNASAVASNTHVKAVGVYGSASYISKAWDTLVGLGSKLKSVLNTTTYDDDSVAEKISTSIGLSISQWLSSSSVLSKITGQKFAIHGASLEDASGILGDGPQSAIVSNIKVQDTSAVVDAAFDTANASSLAVLNNAKVSEVALVDSQVPLDLTYAQITDAGKKTVLDKIPAADFRMNVDEATVSQAFTLQAETAGANLYTYSSNVQTVTVKDTATSVQDNFSTLKDLTKLEAIALNNANDSDKLLTFSATTILQDSSVELLKKITLSPYYLDATSTSMAQLERLHPLNNSVIDPVEPLIDPAVMPNLRNYYLNDTAENISDNYDRLIALGSNLKGMSFTSGTDLSITYTQWQASRDTLDHADFTGFEPDSDADKASYQYILSEVSAQDAVGSVGGASVGSNATTTAVFEDDLVKSVTVKDTAAAISANWNALQTELIISSRTTKLQDLEFTDTNALTLTAAQVVKTSGSPPTYVDLLDKLTPTNKVIVRDTAANIQSKWNDLAALYGTGSGSLGTLIQMIELTDTTKVELTAAQQEDDGGALVQMLLYKNYSVETIA
jgi:hypothetical protein